MNTPDRNAVPADLLLQEIDPLHIRLARQFRLIRFDVQLRLVCLVREQGGYVFRTGFLIDPEGQLGQINSLCQTRRFLIGTVLP